MALTFSDIESVFEMRSLQDRFLSLLIIVLAKYNLIIFAWVQLDANFLQILLCVVIGLIESTTLWRLWLVEAFGALGKIHVKIVDFVEARLRTFLDSTELVAQFRIQIFHDLGHGRSLVGIQLFHSFWLAQTTVSIWSISLDLNLKRAALWVARATVETRRQRLLLAGVELTSGCSQSLGGLLIRHQLC